MISLKEGILILEIDGIEGIEMLGIDIRSKLGIDRLGIDGIVNEMFGMAGIEGMETEGNCGK